ncbi:MAG: host-nuclease inhibitor Gam family protein [Rikenellaceae bacterium]|jgi:phage host-nuclease inhibitor protein Gam|nr:host-nuclease inhibitor Gam family protein [Rikenellaceae bacterium]
MTKTREKKTVVAGVTREAMEEAFGKYADADARIQKIKASIDIEVTRIREKNEESLTNFEKQKADAFDILMTFATENREELFSKKKSMETTHGVLGFRTGTPKVKTRKGFTWAAVINLLRTMAPEYLRLTEEVAKDKLVDDRDSPELAEIMPQIGIYIDRDETFFVEPKKEE